MDDRTEAAQDRDADPGLSRLLQETVRAGVFFQDHVTGEHHWSGALHSLLGLSEDFVISAESFMKLLHPEDHSPVIEQVGRAQADPKRETYAVDMRLRHSGGEYLRMRAHCWMERDENGLVVRERGVLRDLSEAWELEQRLRSAQRRSAAGRVAAGVAHDFNNLLSGILGEASLQLLNGDLPAEQAAAFQSIVDITERATKLTNQLLVFTRRQVVQLHVVDLNAVLRALARMLERVISERCALVFELGEQPLPVRLDRTQIEQVIVNLVVNARDAMPEGGTITLATAAARRGEQDWVRLQIVDTGQGMSPEVLARAQEEFFSTKEHGTGLGLAISRQIVSELGGTLDIHSERGVGTQITIELPRVPEHAVERLGAPTLDRETGAGRRVLVVDDEVLLVDLAVRGLRGFGFEAHGESDRRAALAWLDTQPDCVHALVSDVVMPGMPLDSFLAAFRARCPQAAIVTMSGYAPRQEWQNPLDPSIHFLPKPFTPVTLSQQVQAAIARLGRA